MLRVYNLILYSIFRIMAVLTQYPEGSLRELWKISFPLMLSSFSVMLMVFVDRLLLARYSTAALNASVNASTLGWAFVCGWMALASIAEVFVAQYNGAGRKEKFGEPVWQMVWLSLGSIVFFLPSALWGGVFFYGSSLDHVMEREYFKWMMYFGPSFPVYAALTGFFVGQGKTLLVTSLALGTNLLNVALDVVFIFGIEGVFPSLGVKGAAIATSSSNIFQALVLFGIFINTRNRNEYGTGDYFWKPKAFWECLRIGIPGSIFVVIEILGWASFYWMMTLVGARYITIAGICQSVVILFYFFGEGIRNAVTVIAGNYIGAKRLVHIRQVLVSGARLHLLFFIFMMGFIYFFNDLLIDQFLPDATPEILESYYGSLITCLFSMVVYMFFEGLRLLLSGVLTAAGDTLFLLVAGSLSVWFFLVIPVYFIVVLGKSSIETACYIIVFYSVVACLIYLWRFQKGKWKSMTLFT